MTFGSALHNINVFLFEKNKRVTGAVGAVVILLMVIIVFKLESDDKSDIMLGREDILALINKGGGGPSIDIPGIEDYIQMSEVQSGERDLNEGSSEDIQITSSDEKIITGINVSVTWVDQEDQRRIRMYENQPDTFKVVLSNENGTIREMEKSNEREQRGEILLNAQFDDEQIKEYYESGDFTVSIILENAGDYEPRVGLGFRTLPDNSNSMEYEITVEYLGPDMAEEQK